MQSTLALNIPQRGPTRSPFYIALIDVVAGLLAFNIWGRLGWRATKRRYRRTVFGPFWTTVSVALFVLTLGLLWSMLMAMIAVVFYMLARRSAAGALGRA